MSDECCSVPDAGSSACELRIQPVNGVCPTNGKVGKSVDSLTLKAMLARPLTDLRPVEYRFCKDADCPTVYYSVDGLQTFTEADLRERVYQKHPDENNVFVCYCFRHTVEDVLLDVATTKGAAITAQINQGIKNGQCACDLRNPQGSCCLGNVSMVIKHAQQNLAREKNFQKTKEFQMTTVTYTVPAISCMHCTHTIETEVAELQGVQSVKAEVESKKVVIMFDAPADESKIKALLAEIDYPVEGLLTL